MNVLDEIVKDQLRSDIPELAPGDTVKSFLTVVARRRLDASTGFVLITIYVTASLGLIFIAG